MHIHNLDFSADYGAQHSFFMFEFDSHQVLFALMLCILSTSIISFYWLHPIPILNWWSMISDPIKIQSWSEYLQNRPRQIREEEFSKTLQMDFIFLWNITDKAKKKVVLFAEIVLVKKFLSLTRPHSRMCIRINIFNFKNKIQEI